MVWKYTVACMAILLVLGFLKFVEDSPIRSWKTAFLVGIPLSFITCYWVNCAFPAAPPPVPPTEKASAYQAELLRTFRRIEGVDRANITGSLVEINFVQDKPMSALKSVARSCGVTAAYFLKTGKSNAIKIRISVRGYTRYEMDYDTGRGVTNEQEF